jgi:hypothetical protein
MGIACLQSYKLEMMVHKSAVDTLRTLAKGAPDVTQMLAVSCRESENRVIQLSLYHDSFEGEDCKPLKVDTFVAVKRTAAVKEQVRSPRLFNNLFCLSGDGSMGNQEDHVISRPSGTNLVLPDII